jgi:hypothetical protein
VPLQYGEARGGIGMSEQEQVQHILEHVLTEQLRTNALLCVIGEMMTRYFENDYAAVEYRKQLKEVMAVNYVETSITVETE